MCKFPHGIASQIPFHTIFFKGEMAKGEIHL